MAREPTICHAVQCIKKSSRPTNPRVLHSRANLVVHLANSIPKIDGLNRWAHSDFPAMAWSSVWPSLLSSYRLPVTRIAPFHVDNMIGSTIQGLTRIAPGFSHAGNMGQQLQLTAHLHLSSECSMSSVDNACEASRPGKPRLQLKMHSLSPVPSGSNFMSSRSAGSRKQCSLTVLISIGHRASDRPSRLIALVAVGRVCSRWGPSVVDLTLCSPAQGQGYRAPGGPASSRCPAVTAILITKLRLYVLTIKS